MFRRFPLILFCLWCVAACSRGADHSSTADTATRSHKEQVGPCRILTAADIRAVTGVEVHYIGRGSAPGAGGTCGNFATPDSEAYLGVNDLHGASAYDMAVSAVPEDVYPKRQAVPGLGDEAVLMKDETGMLRYLVARKGDHGVVLFPLGRDGRAMSDSQLRQLAERALATQ